MSSEIDQPEPLFFYSAFTNLTLSLASTAVLIVVLNVLRRSLCKSKTASASPIGNIVASMMLTNCIMAIAVGLLPISVILFTSMYNPDISEKSAKEGWKVCWPFGISLYFAVLNGHIWALGLAAHVLTLLISRLGGSQSSREFASYCCGLITYKAILCFDIIAGCAYSAAVTAQTASVPPYTYVVIGAGCWSSGESTTIDWMIMAPMATFAMLESVLFISAEMILRKHKERLPWVVSSTFWSVLRFTGSVLLVDSCLAIALVADHLYRIFSNSYDIGGNQMVDVLVVIEAVCMFSYPGVSLGLLLDDHGVLWAAGAHQ